MPKTAVEDRDSDACPTEGTRLTDETLEGLSEHRSLFDAVVVVGSKERTVGIERVVLGLRVQRPPAVHSSSKSNRSAVIDNHRDSGRVPAGEIDLGDQPGEEREDLVERHKSVEVGRERLVDRSVAPSKRERLLGDARLV